MFGPGGNSIAGSRLAIAGGSSRLAPEQAIVDRILPACLLAALLLLAGSSTSWAQQGGYQYHPTLPAPSAAPSPTLENPKSPVRGNRRSMIYHWPGCPFYDAISERNRVEFPSAKAAEAAGYRPARNCL
jgi:hypothetical protein